MPGTIQVSVSLTGRGGEGEARPSGVSLKVAMGKREFQTMENGDFAFPLVSLRENLVLSMYNADGNSIWHTEFKASLVAEKGILDDEFSVGGGGVIRVRMQFSLSEEDRMRIREMRNSALKRKNSDLMKGGYEGHASVSHLHSSLLLRSTKEHYEGLFSKDIAQKSEIIGNETNESSTQGLRERDVSSSGVNESRQLVFSSLGEPIKESTFSLAELQDHIDAPHKEKFTDRNSSNKVMKMISAFESSSSQEHNVSPTTSFLPSKKLGESLQGTSSEENDLEKLIHQTMTKPFSSGMLSDSNLQGDPKIPRLDIAKQRERNEHSHDVNCEEAAINKNQLSNSEINKRVYNLESTNQKATEVRNVQCLQSQASKSSTVAQKSIMTGEAISQNRSTDHVNEMVNDRAQNVERDPAAISTYKNSSELIKSDALQEGGFNAVIDSSIETANETLSYNNEEQKVFSANKGPFQAEKGSSSIEKESRRINHIPSEDGSLGEAPIASNTSGGITLSRIKNLPDFVTRQIPVEEEKTKPDETDYSGVTTDHDAKAVFERNGLDEAPLMETVADGSVIKDDICGLWIPQQESTTNSVSNEFFCGCCINDLKDQLPFGHWHESMDILVKRENFLFGSFATWVPNHVCVTTAGPRLRNLFECCSKCFGPLSAEETSPVPASSQKQKIIDSSLVEVAMSEKIIRNFGCVNHDDPVGSRNSYERLIDQGARIIIVIVACGILLLSTK